LAARSPGARGAARARAVDDGRAARAARDGRRQATAAHAKHHCPVVPAPDKLCSPSIHVGNASGVGARGSRCLAYTLPFPCQDPTPRQYAERAICHPKALLLSLFPRRRVDTDADPDQGRLRYELHGASNAHCHRVRRVQSLPGGLQDLREGTALGPGHRPPRFWLFSTTASLHFPTPSIGGMRPPQVEPDADLQTLASSTYAPAPRLTSFGMGARGLDAFAVFYSSEKCSMCLWAVTHIG
jgi:hypothetical protein